MVTMVNTNLVKILLKSRQKYEIIKDALNMYV